MSFTCPRCGAVSHHPKDEEHGYCGRCHDFTADPEIVDRLDTGTMEQLVKALVMEGRISINAGRRLMRLDHVDTALAKRVGDMIAHNATVKVKLTDWLKAYPLTVFPEPDHKKAHELLKAGGQTLDAVSADMARHVLTRVLEMIAAEPES